MNWIGPNTMGKNMNPTIGFITCPFTGQRADLRRCRTGQRLFYYVSDAGKITPNLSAGQRFIFDHATFNDPEDRRQLAKKLGILGTDPVAVPEQAPEPNPGKPEVGSRVAANDDDSEQVVITRISSGPRPEPVPEPTRTPKPARAANDDDDIFSAMGW